MNYSFTSGSVILVLMFDVSVRCRHQREQNSLMKTLSQASFSQIPSGTNLAALSNNYNNSNNNGNHTQRSHSLPADTNNLINGSDKSSLINSSKKEKKEEKGAGDPGMLEFVKVDVDNNMVGILQKLQGNVALLKYIGKT